MSIFQNILSHFLIGPVTWFGCGGTSHVVLGWISLVEPIPLKVYGSLNSEFPFS